MYGLDRVCVTEINASIDNLLTPPLHLHCIASQSTSTFPSYKILFATRYTSLHLPLKPSLITPTPVSVSIATQIPFVSDLCFPSHISKMDTLTPPPSFRALRVRTRTRANSYSFVAQADENKCPQCEAQAQVPSAMNADESLRSHTSLLEKRFVESQSRGRSRQRLPRLGLKVDVPSTRPRQLSLVIPQSASCCSSSVSSQNKAQSPTHEEELMFTMSPVKTHSPASLFLNNFNSDINAGNARSIHELVATKSVAEQTSEKVLSALWTPSRGGTLPTKA